jgi:uncharacterized protein (TIGR03067 family)
LAKLLLEQKEMEGTDVKKFWNNLHIDGKWKVVEMERNGRKHPNAHKCDETWNFLSTALLRSEKSKRRETLYIVRTDAAQRPPHIDLLGPAEQRNGTLVRGIYSVENGRLRICLPKLGTKGNGRPKSFSTLPKSGLSHYVLERFEQ